MKKFKEILSAILAVPVTAVTLLVMAIRSVLTAPFRWLRYRQSSFYRDLGEPLRSFKEDSGVYEMYNLVKDRNLPIQFFPKDPQKPSAGGWFLYKGTLILHDLRVMRYLAEENRWMVHYATPLMEYVLGQVAEVNKVPGHMECTQMFLPVNRKEIIKADRARAEQDFRFVLYDKGELGEILDAYIRTHPYG